MDFTVKIEIKNYISIIIFNNIILFNNISIYYSIINVITTHKKVYL